MIKRKGEKIVLAAIVLDLVATIVVFALVGLCYGLYISGNYYYPLILIIVIAIILAALLIGSLALYIYSTIIAANMENNLPLLLIIIGYFVSIVGLVGLFLLLSEIKKIESNDIYKKDKMKINGKSIGNTSGTPKNVTHEEACVKLYDALKEEGISFDEVRERYLKQVEIYKKLYNKEPNSSEIFSSVINSINLNNN